MKQWLIGRSRVRQEGGDVPLKLFTPWWYRDKPCRMREEEAARSSPFYGCVWYSPILDPECKNPSLPDPPPFPFTIEEVRQGRAYLSKLKLLKIEQENETEAIAYRARLLRRREEADRREAELTELTEKRLEEDRHAASLSFWQQLGPTEQMVFFLAVWGLVMFVIWVMVTYSY